ncbi:uncharacterized protein LOC130675654 isoform X2 [Microplitis mediator]|uniref:uncharacterized protein LOC130675654 isoform X2 n=1 Tax=Microplitis mediator TaxID=375433 RepID=UPI002556281A|nr:uncharacterized protein LOC130675654 isoform X2 [Microplitis mediator]
MKIGHWHLIIFFPIHFGVLAENLTTIKNVEVTTKKFVQNIMKLQPAISLSQPEIVNNSLLLNHWRKHIHHGKRHRKSIENSRKRHVSLLSTQKNNNLSIVLPMNWKKNKLNMSSSLTKDPQQTIANLIQRLINLNHISSFLSTHSPINNKSQIINTENNHHDENNITNAIVNHISNYSDLPVTPNLFKKTYKSCNPANNSSNGLLCNEYHFSNFSIFKTPLSLKDNLTTPSSFLARLSILNESLNKSEDLKLNQQFTSDPLKIFKKKLPLVTSEIINATTVRSSFIIIDELGFFGDPIEDTPDVKPKESYHSRPSSIFDYIFGENNDKTAPEIENQLKHVDLWNMEINRTERVEPESFTMKFKLIGDNNVSEPQYNLRMNKKNVEEKMKNNYIPLRSIKQPKSKILNEADFQSAFLSTFYISIAMCGIFFAIVVWWRRFSIIKKSNFTTISDSVHLPPTPSSPLAAQRAGQLRV